jgi:hypothetical protein
VLAAFKFAATVTPLLGTGKVPARVEKKDAQMNEDDDVIYA